MSLYHHLSTDEREWILLFWVLDCSIRQIAMIIGRSAATVSRELNRNWQAYQNLSVRSAQEAYMQRRLRCHRQKLLSDEYLKEHVMFFLWYLRWSPEQIANRMRYEESPKLISATTIYRGIYAGDLDQLEPPKRRKAVKRLRHKGKRRHRKGEIETRGKFEITYRISDRPSEANKREALGHWEGDTLLGKAGSACLVTLTDRKSRYLLSGKADRKQAEIVGKEMVALLSALPQDRLKSMTVDRGKEFAGHKAVTSALGGMRFYFADPHAPWQRGTNENTNGLLRDYFPKSRDIARCSDKKIAWVTLKMNVRPRKCLGWKTPYEAFFGEVLHLI